MLENEFGDNGDLPKSILVICQNAARLYDRRLWTEGSPLVTLMVVEPKDDAPYVEVRSEYGVVCRMEISAGAGRLKLLGN